MSLIAGILGSIWDSAFYGSSASQKSSDDSYWKQLGLMREQQRWQEYVAKNHHSWEVQSLRDAGLNPLLSATGGVGASSGGAPSFGGGSGSGGRSNLNPMDDVSSVVAIVKSIEEALNLKKQAKKLDAEIEYINEQTKGKKLENKHRMDHPSSGDHPYNRLMNNLDSLGKSTVDLFTGDGTSSVPAGKKVYYKDSNGNWKMVAPNGQKKLIDFLPKGMRDNYYNNQ